jgi:hypothetical protein
LKAKLADLGEGEQYIAVARRCPVCACRALALKFFCRSNDTRFLGTLAAYLIFRQLRALLG